MVPLARPAARVGGTKLLVAVPIENPAKSEPFEGSSGHGTMPYAGMAPWKDLCGLSCMRNFEFSSAEVEAILPSGVELDKISTDSRKCPIWPPQAAVGRWRCEASIGASSVQNLYTKPKQRTPKHPKPHNVSVHYGTLQSVKCRPRY